MTPKQQKFCDFYLQSGNATEAAEKAGYSRKTAYSVGSENLRKPELEKYIAEHMKKAHSERIAGADEVLEFWTQIMRDKENGMKERLRASENLGKRMGLDSPNQDGEEQNGKEREKEKDELLECLLTRKVQGFTDEDDIQ